MIVEWLTIYIQESLQESSSTSSLQRPSAGWYYNNGLWLLVNQMEDNTLMKTSQSLSRSDVYAHQRKFMTTTGLINVEGKHNDLSPLLLRILFFLFKKNEQWLRTVKKNYY